MPIMQKKSISWVWIVIAFIVFWPIGILLLIKKLGDDRSAMIKCGRPVAVISYILFAIGLISLIIAITGDYGAFGVSALFITGGVLVNRIARKTRKRGERYKQYIMLIVNQSINSLDAITGIVNVPYEMVVDDLQQMIKAGYFHGAYIDFAQRLIVFAPPTPHVWQQPVSGPAPWQPPPQIRVVTCRNCGANNKVIGQVSDCEYCGSPIQ